MIPELALLVASATGSPAAPAVHLDRQAVRQFADCAASKYPVLADRYVLHRYADGGFQSDRDLRKLRDDACAAASSSKQGAKAIRNMPEDLFKLALADSLVQQNMSVFDEKAIANAQTITDAAQIDALWKKPEECKGCKPERLKELENVRQTFAAKLAPHAFSECVVRADPAKVHTMLMTDVNSPAEGASFDALGPAFSQCLVEGQQFKSTLPMMRGFIALNYYRVAKAPRIAKIGAVH